MKKAGRPKFIDPTSKDYARRVVRCNLILEIQKKPELSKEFKLSALFRLVSVMKRQEARDAFEMSTDELANLLRSIEAEGREGSGASLRDFYYHFWSPTEAFSFKVAKRLWDLLPSEYSSYELHQCAEKVSEEGISPHASNAIHLPPGNILKHYYKNVQKLKAQAHLG